MTSAFQCVYSGAQVALIACIFQAGVTSGAPSHGAAHSLQKRNVYQLCNVVGSYTNRMCTDYNDYGCFCGMGNMGNNPVDAVDRCCYEHDNCYGRVSCWSSFFAYFTTYTYECEGRSCTCKDSLSDYPCARTACQCDVEFGQCLANLPFNEMHMGYNRTANCN